MRLTNTNIKAFNFTIPQGAPFKAVIISDLHIGQFGSKDEATESIIANLQRAVASENATHVFILGDMIHLGAFNLPRHWTALFKALERIGVEVHAIPGNHDRVMFRVACKEYKGTRVFPHNCHAMVIRQAVEGPTAVLGHHLNNDKKVHATHDVRLWYKALRRTFDDVIKEDALLVLGHLHQVTDSEDGLTKSVLMFSHDLHSWAYAVLERQDDIEGHPFVLSRKFL